MDKIKEIQMKIGQSGKMDETLQRTNKISRWKTLDKSSYNHLKIVNKEGTDLTYKLNVFISVLNNYLKLN